MHLRQMTAFLHAKDYNKMYDKIDEGLDGGMGDNLWACFEGRRWGDELDAIVLARYWGAGLSIYQFKRDREGHPIDVLPCHKEEGKTKVHIRLFFEQSHYIPLSRFDEPRMRTIWEHFDFDVLLLTVSPIETVSSVIVQREPTVSLHRISAMNYIKYMESTLKQRHRDCKNRLNKLAPLFDSLLESYSVLFKEVRAIEKVGRFTEYNWKLEGDKESVEVSLFVLMHQF